MSPLHFLVSQKKEDTHDTILLRKRILFYCCPIKPLHAALLSLNAAEILMISSNFQFQAPLE